MSGEGRLLDTERALREAEGRYRALFETANDAIVVADAETGIIVDVNTRACRLLGRSRAEIIGLGQAELHPPEAAEEYAEIFRRHVAADQGVVRGVDVQRADGRRVAVEISASVFTLGGRRMIQGLFRETGEPALDVHTERRRRRLFDLLAEVAAIANEARSAEAALRTCVERICRLDEWPVGHVYLRDPDAPDVLVPSDIWHLQDPARFAEWDRCTREQVFETGGGLPGRVAACARPVWVADVTVQPWFVRREWARKVGIRSGFAFPVVVGAEVVSVLEFYSTEHTRLDPELQEILGQVGAQLGRVVERERAVARLTEAKNLAEAASRAKSTFLASMSHELRTPLNAILGFSDIMRRGELGRLGTPRYAEYLDGIHQSATHLLELINDILDVSAVEAGRLSLGREPVDMAAAVATAVRLVRPRADARGVTLDEDLAADLPALVGDARRIKQVLLNLLGNAVKFTPPGGAVTLRTRPSDDGGVVLTIRDTGIGMDADGLAVALQPFGQVDNLLTRREEGSGLGLPLARALTELMGGRLTLESTPGQGTTATVALPALGGAADAGQPLDDAG